MHPLATIYQPSTNHQLQLTVFGLPVLQYNYSLLDSKLGDTLRRGITCGDSWATPSANVKGWAMPKDARPCQLASCAPPRHKGMGPASTSTEPSRSG